MIFCTLKTLLDEYDVTQTKISEATGITRPTLLQLIKNENRSIRYDTIDKLCRYFNIEMEELIKRSKYEVKYGNSQLSHHDTNETWIGHPETYIETSMFIDTLELKFKSGDVNYYFENHNSIDFDKKNDIPFICEIDSDSFLKYLVAEMDGETFYSYIDTFSIREKIAEELNISNQVTARLNFQFKVINKEKKDFDNLSEELKKLSKEELYGLFQKHFYKQNLDERANNVTGVISRDYFNKPFDEMDEHWCG